MAFDSRRRHERGAGEEQIGTNSEGALGKVGQRRSNVSTAPRESTAARAVEKHRLQAAAPALSVLDESLACVLWFALRGEGKDYDDGGEVR